MTDSIYHGAAIGLSLYASNPGDFHVSRLDFGRGAGPPRPGGLDNENTLESQGERYTTFLRDLELVDDESRLTEVGAQVKAELTLPIHMSLRDLAGQLNPGGPDAAVTEGEAERAARAPAVARAGGAAGPAGRGAGARGRGRGGPGRERSVGGGPREHDRAGRAHPRRRARPGAQPPPPADPGRPVPPSDIWDTAAPDEATRAYSAIRPEEAAAAAVGPEPAATDTDAPDEAMTSGDPLAAPPAAEAEPGSARGARAGGARTRDALGRTAGGSGGRRPARGGRRRAGGGGRRA